MDRPNLADHFIAQAWHGIAKKRWFGRERVRFSDFMVSQVTFFAHASILGRARRDSVKSLVVMLATKPGHEKGAIRFLREKVKQRLAAYEIGPNSTFADLIFNTEFHDADAETRAAIVRRWDKHEFPIDQVRPRLQKIFFEGIAFGSLYPEATEALYQRQWGNDPRVPSFDAMEWHLLVETTAFALQHYPELVEPLNLKSYKV